VRALAELTDAEFEANLASIIKGQARIKRMQTALLIDGVDYGNIPGVDKPSLGKPGAEKFTLAYNTTAEITRSRVVGDNITTPLISYDARCDMHLGSFDGPVIGVGFGTCNSWEAKYRYRNADRICPQCSKPTIIKGKAEYGGGWLCFAKKGGCGAKFAEDAKAIVDQQVGQIENPDPWDLANTIMKMAEKRAHVDATLRTFAASGIFTQDMEDNVPTDAPAKPAAPAAAPVARPAAPPPARPAPISGASVTPAPHPADPNEPPPISDDEMDSLSGSMGPAPQQAPQAAPQPVGDTCPKHGAPWKGEPGDLYHKTDQGYCRPDGQPRKPR
jgi:hypothetical protein